MVDYFDKLQRLRAGTLAPKDFSHTDHVGVAYEALMRHDYVEAVGIISRGIKTLAAAAGDTSKFNATITMAFVSLIAERMQASAHDNAADFLTRNADLTGPDVLAPWYSRERITSPLARSIALLPDRAP
ncbi:hypothetical protein [Anderseniella sp. Alg231-50]|uniref:hypothetical protein n=1 Tax=Anderseniella sp. Alg231-50 TaxID=1922226 RepID=UPI000D562CCB